MIEEAKVLKVKDNNATLRIEKKDECSKCGMCLFPKNASHIDIPAKSDIEVNEGDKVLVETSEGGKLMGALLVFGVPLLLTAVCVLIGLLIFKSEIIVLASAILTIVLWEIVLHFIDKKMGKTNNFTAKIISVIEKNK